jgi:cysteine desulfurase
MNRRVYLDYNASAPLLAVARHAMLAQLDQPGNASSVHKEGREQKRAVQTARRAIAELLGANADNVLFTSGATEAAAMLLTPHWMAGRGTFALGRLLVGATEHPCIAAGGRFAPSDTAIIPVLPDGVIDVAAFDVALSACQRDGVRPLVAIQVANNETGVLQDCAALAARAHAAGGLFVADAAQAAGRLPLDITALGADAVILSAHKMGGPKGAGAIVFAGEIVRPQPLLNGGGQERGLRAGTENAPAIAGFGAAVQWAIQTLPSRQAIAALRTDFEARLLTAVPGAVVHGAPAHRLDNTSFVSFPGLKAETAMIGFDLAGIAVSSGSACSSGKVGRSAVLEAMGWPGEEGAVRFSLGPDTSAADMDRALVVIATLASRRA